MKTTLLIMAAGIGSRFGTGIKQLEPVDASNHIIMDYSIGNGKSLHQGKDGFGYSGQQAEADAGQPHQPGLQPGIGYCTAVSGRNHGSERAHQPLMEKPMNQKPSLHQMEHYQKFYENGEYVRAVESTTEQNYNMIDGCANNLPKPRIINGRESVLDKLRIRQMAREKQKSSQEQSADMERNRK